MSRLALQFVCILAFILITGYLIPAGQYYYWYYVRNNREKDAWRIQQRQATREGIRREIRMSLQSILIFAVMGTVLWRMWRAGQTAVYLDPAAYGWWYLPVSFLLCVLFHDTYFYWTHRLMHWRPLFKYMHAGHHRSVTPTPWAIYAFQPAEAVVQFLGIMAIVIFIPVHPVVLFAFLWYDTMVNTAGHCGYEIVPSWISSHPVLRVFNTVYHHDSHHTNMGRNYGVFFNVWDRLMGTFLDASIENPVTRHVPAKAGRPVARSGGGLETAGA